MVQQFLEWEFPENSAFSEPAGELGGWMFWSFNADGLLTTQSFLNSGSTIFQKIPKNVFFWCFLHGIVSCCQWEYFTYLSHSPLFCLVFYWETGTPPTAGSCIFLPEQVWWNLVQTFCATPKIQLAAVENPYLYIYIYHKSIMIIMYKWCSYSENICENGEIFQCHGRLREGTVQLPRHALVITRTGKSIDFYRALGFEQEVRQLKPHVAQTWYRYILILLDYVD